MHFDRLEPNTDPVSRHHWHLRWPNGASAIVRAIWTPGLGAHPGWDSAPEGTRQHSLDDPQASLSCFHFDENRFDGEQAPSLGSATG